MTHIWNRLRGERGSLMTTMVFIIVGSFVAAASLAFLLLRSSNDYALAQQANVKSAIGQLASNVLGEVNSEFPDDWPNLDAADLRAATEPLGDAPELNARAYLGYFAINDATGVITAEIVGEATTPGAVTVTAEVKLTPSGAGIFQGLDDAGRPVWIYANDNLDALALWEMAPNAMQYITPDGDYIAEPPANAPTVAIEYDVEQDAAVATVAPVYCRYGGRAEYQQRHAIGSDEMGDWSAWGRGPAGVYELDEGQQLRVDARARCRSNLGNSPASDVSPTATYVRPFAQVTDLPEVAITGSGSISWSATEDCAEGLDQYRVRTRSNDGAWSTWSVWGPNRSAFSTVREGNKLDAEVQARCGNAVTAGPDSEAADATYIRPFASAPGSAQVVASGAVSVNVQSAASCPFGSSPQFRYRHQLNSDGFSDWSEWSASRVHSFSAPENARTETDVAQRCATGYAASDARITKATWYVPITATPTNVGVNFDVQGGSYTIVASGCPTGSELVGRWSHTVEPNTPVVVASSWTAVRSTAVTIGEGRRISVGVETACRGNNGGAVGPSTASAVFAAVRPITTAPASPQITVSTAQNGLASWNAAGCPAGTVTQYSWARVHNTGTFSYSPWVTQTATSVSINEGERVAFSVQARCANTANAVASESSQAETGWRIRGVTRPAAVVNMRPTGNPYLGVAWDAASCAAGTTARYNAWAVTDANLTVFTSNSQLATFASLPGNRTAGGLRWFVEAVCVGTYAQSTPSTPSVFRRL